MRRSARKRYALAISCILTAFGFFLMHFGFYQEAWGSIFFAALFLIWHVLSGRPFRRRISWEETAEIDQRPNSKQK